MRREGGSDEWGPQAACTQRGAAYDKGVLAWETSTTRKSDPAALQRLRLPHDKKMDMMT